MGKIILDDNYIKSLPITTNRIEVSWDKDKFFAKYSIVSYYSTDPERKNLAYEQLGNVPFISVTGIKNRWGAQHFPSVQFFILTTKGKEQEVLNSLRAYLIVLEHTTMLKLGIILSKSIKINYSKESLHH